MHAPSDITYDLEVDMRDVGSAATTLTLNKEALVEIHKITFVKNFAKKAPLSISFLRQLIVDVKT